MSHDAPLSEKIAQLRAMLGVAIDSNRPAPMCAALGIAYQALSDLAVDAQCDEAEIERLRESLAGIEDDLDKALSAIRKVREIGVDVPDIWPDGRHG